MQAAAWPWLYAVLVYMYSSNKDQNFLVPYMPWRNKCVHDSHKTPQQASQLPPDNQVGVKAEATRSFTEKRNIPTQKFLLLQHL